MVNYPLSWCAKFYRHPIEGVGTIFIAEQQSYLINTLEYTALNNIICQQGMLSNFIFDKDDSLASNTVSQVQRLKRVDALIADEVLARAEDQATDYFTPDFNTPYLTTTIGSRPVYWLSGLPIDDCLDKLSALLISADIAIVVIDDYFDPRLHEVSQAFEQSDTPWIPIKLTGEMPTFGPLFNVHAPHQRTQTSPCFECLHYRLRRNYPVREWLRRATSSLNHTALPVVNNPTIRSNALQAFVEYIQVLQNPLSETLEKTLFTYTPNKENILEHHHVIKRPQCAACGNPDLHRSQYMQAIRLDDDTKNDDFDGGYRIQSRQQTLSLLQNHISPVTGCISDITSLTPKILDDDRPTLQIYRAAYFQNTYSDNVPTADTFVQLSLGKGVSDVQARTSALGEAMERLAAQYHGDEPTLYSRAADVKGDIVTPSALTPFSAKQIKAFAQRSSADLQHPQWLQPLPEDTLIHWLQGWSLSKQTPVFFPASYCLANTPFDDHIYTLYNHNGNAAGNSREEAILQGALELIERDAAAIWWYNQIPRPAFDLNIVDAGFLKPIDNSLQAQWHYWVLDITNNIPVPCCAAIAQHKDSGEFVMGFGCHLDSAIACQRALTEMYQLIIVKDQVSGPFDFKAIVPRPYLFPKRNSSLKNQDSYPLLKNSKIKNDILYMIEMLKNKDFDLCVVDYSRADLPLSTVKVIIPGLCHFWPQFGNERLFNVPVLCQWLSRTLREEELNPIPLYL